MKLRDALLPLLVFTLHAPRAAAAEPAVGPLPPLPPPAPIREVRDVYFGTTVVDPYRWLEDQHAPEPEKFVRAQDAYTRAVLARIPGRDALRTRVAALTGSDVVLTSVDRAGERYFYLKRAPGWDNYKLVMRDGAAGSERVLFDPEKSAAKGAPHLSIDYYEPSPDGSLVALGASPGGSEDSSLYVLDAKSGRVVEGPIDRAQSGSPTWLGDGHSFTYARRQILTPGMPETARYQKRRSYFHVVGTPAEKDVPLIGIGVTGSPEIAVDDSPFLFTQAGTPWLFAVIQHGARREQTVYAAPLDQRPSAPPAWHKLFDVGDEITNFAAHGNDLYLLTHKSASRYQIIRVATDKPDLTHAQTIIAPGRAVLTSLAAAKDALYVVTLDGGINHLLRVSYGDAQPVEVPLPFPATLDNLVARPEHNGVVVGLEGWTHAVGFYSSDGKKLALLSFSPKSRVDFSRIEAEEVNATSADGTVVPLSILHQRGLPLDGNNPTLLNGYGSYGIPMQPHFAPSQLAWLERGGVFAMAHLRGGGEFGEDWHKAGQKETKQHTIDDFIACAEYLIAHKYTRAPRLAGSGTSAGGITIAGAITQRPELFGAALIRVGDSDILRTEFATDGPGNAEEYGTVKVKSQFEAMYKVSGYQRVRNGVRYPAVMLTGGFNDPRVALYQSSKMAARLQAATASGKPILLRVDFDAGHGMGSTKSQRDDETADALAFLSWQLGVPQFQPAP